MATIEDVTLWTHVAAGFAALFAGLGALATRKGGRRHRLCGRTYVYSMVVVSGTAIGLYVVSPVFIRLLLGLVAVFSFYFAFSGYRALARKRPVDTAARVDWLAVGLLVASSSVLVVAGVDLWQSDAGIGPVVLVFGVIGLVFGVNDVRTFRGETESGAWVGEHVTRMGAGYIATVSAFSAVNFQFLPFVLRWLWPTLLGSPLLAYLVNKYESEFGVA